MSYFDDFDNFLGEILAEAREKEQSLFKRWLNKIGYTKPIFYCKKSSEKIMEIHTINPGMLIGRQGANIIEFKKMLSEEYGDDWQVKLVEIRGDFVIAD